MHPTPHPDRADPSPQADQAARPAVRRAGLSKPVIGVIGGVGSGKSLVARQMATLGGAIIDADALAHEVLRQPAVRDTLVRWWGRDMLDAQGQIDRPALGRRVFGQPDALRKLESLVHPGVHELRQQWRRTYDADPAIRFIVEDCPLLLECGLDQVCDKVVFVQADLAVRQARVARGRGWSAEDLERREKNQWGLDIKAGQADYVINNSEGESQTFDQVRRVLFEIIPALRQ